MDSKKELSRRDMLLNRSKRCRCKYCGGKLSIKRIVFSEFEDARLELYCESCQRLEFGVEQEIYEVSKYFVEDVEFDCFPNFPDNDHKKQMNIAKVCEILSLGCRQLGVLNEIGFTDESRAAKATKISKCLILSADEIENMEANDK